VTQCAACTVHVETRSAGFLVEPQNQGRWFVSGLASKPVTIVFSGLASKSVVMVSLGLTLKPVVGFLVEPQNQGDGGFLGLFLKTDNYGLMIWGSKSPRQFLCLGLKTKHALICQLHHKTDRGRLTWDTCRDLAACFTWKQVELGFSV
jgi:hypothetical protein